MSERKSDERLTTEQIAAVQRQLREMPLWAVAGLRQVLNTITPPAASPRPPTPERWDEPADGAGAEMDTGHDVAPAPLAGAGGVPPPAPSAPPTPGDVGHSSRTPPSQYRRGAPPPVVAAPPVLPSPEGAETGKRRLPASRNPFRESQASVTAEKRARRRLALEAAASRKRSAPLPVERYEAQELPLPTAAQAAAARARLVETEGDSVRITSHAPPESPQPLDPSGSPTEDPLLAMVDSVTEAKRAAPNEDPGARLAMALLPGGAPSYPETLARAAAVSHALVNAPYQAAGRHGSVPMSLMPGGITNIRRASTKFGRDRDAYKAMRAIFEEYADSLERTASDYGHVGPRMAVDVTAGLRLMAQGATGFQNLVKTSVTTTSAKSAVAVAQRNYSSARPLSIHLYKWEPVGVKIPGQWPYHITTRASDTTVKATFSLGASQLDPAFREALYSTARSLSAMPDSDPASLEARTLVAEGLERIVHYASKAVLSTGTPETYQARFLKGAAVGCLSATARTYSFEPSPTGLRDAFIKSMSREVERTAGDAPIVVGPAPSLAEIPALVRDFTDDDVHGEFMAQFTVAPLPGFGVAVTTDGVTMHNPVLWADANRLIFDGAMGGARSEFPDALRSARLWSVDNFELASQLLESNKGRAEPTTWGLNPHSSAGPQFDRKPNLQASGSIAQFWSTTFARLPKAMDLNAGRLPPTFVNVVMTFDGKPKDELVPCAYYFGPPSKSRIIYSGTLDLPQALFLGVFEKTADPIEHHSLLGFNATTDHGLMTLLADVARRLAVTKHIAMTFSDNGYLAISNGRDVPDDSPFRLGLRRLGYPEWDHPMTDFQWVSIDVTSMESCQAPRAGRTMWRLFFDTYDSVMTEAGFLGMSPTVRNIMELMVEARSEYVYAVLGHPVKINNLMPSGVPDTGIRNQFLAHHATFIINQLEDRIEISFTSQYANGSPTHYWSEHVVTEGGAQGPVRIPRTILSAYECVGMLPKIESVVGDSEKGVIALLTETPNEYLPIDLLGYGCRGLVGDSGAVYVVPVLAPERLYPAIAYAKGRPTALTDSTDRAIVTRVSKGMSLLLSGAVWDTVPRQILMTMVKSAGVMALTRPVPDTESVESMVAEVFAQADLGVSPTSAASLAASVFSSQTIGVNWFTDLLLGPAATEDLEGSFGLLYNVSPQLEPMLARPDYMVTRAPSYLYALLVDPEGPESRRRYDDSPPVPRGTPGSLTRARTTAEEVLRDERRYKDVKIPEHWVMPDPAPDRPQPKNYRPLLWSSIYHKLPIGGRTFSVGDWFMALHQLERTAFRRYSINPESLRRLEERSKPAALPTNRASTGVLTAPKSRKAAAKVASALGRHGLVTEEQLAAIEAEEQQGDEQELADDDNLEDDDFVLKQ